MHGIGDTFQASGQLRPGAQSHRSPASSPIRSSSGSQRVSTAHWRACAPGSVGAGGVMDDARTDEELMFVRAMDDIDAWHIELLDHMASNAVPQPAPGWSARTAVEAVPIVADVVNAVLGALELHRLIAPTLPPISRGPNAGQTFYNITNSGRRFLDRLHEEAPKQLVRSIRHGGRTCAALSRMSPGNAPSGPGKRIGLTAPILCMSATMPRRSPAKSSRESSPFPCT